MKKNTLIAIILSTLVIIGSTYLQLKLYPPPAQEEQQPAQSEKSVQSTETVPQNTFVAETELGSKSAGGVEFLSNPDSDDQNLTEKIYTVKTSLVEASFTNKGGDIISYKLLEHYGADSTENVEMIKNLTESNRAFSIALGNQTAPIVDQLFHVKEEKLSGGAQAIGFYKTISIRNQDASISSFILAKRYIFYPDNYMFELQVSINGDESLKGLNFNSAGYTLKTPPQIGPDWNTADKYEYRTFMSFSKEKEKTKSYTLKTDSVQEITDPVGWVSISGKYFTTIVIPQDSNTIQSTFLLAPKNAQSPIQDNQIALIRKIIAGSAIIDIYHVYIGPCTENYLSPYNIPSKNPFQLDNIRIDSVAASGGLLYPLEVGLKWVLQFFYKIIPNWGVAIILVTLLIKLLFYPLTKKSFVASQRMQELQPQMQTIQAKYKNNPQKLNEEMAKFYKEAGYNPLSGCLTLLVQMPFLFAMYRLFNNYFEFRGAMFIPHWIPDLSIGDSIWKLPFTVPFFGWTDLRLLPILYVVSQIVFSKITQPPATEQQNSSMKMMLYFMPVFFFFLFYNAPSGLLVYWTAMNLMTLVQQLFIKQTMHHTSDAKNKKEVKYGKGAKK
ncbi:membrane protein insertase, YidC/Oxa1 family domain protein [Treponema phagedenis F0421]|uniref:membrane protein insertase YidC n=1 Tax=Treponema phagedenis TaxID=162 RepID=UPI0001F63B0B|nr:membrane protein insertase YidC [Treponema phagedenis]EFW38652.1 membrane protein insertase, YidC/Oxa1 family domain protein [Treponema phagedenis F0421]